MATSAKRYGLESADLETELRFRRIEARLEELAGTGDFGAVTDDVKRVVTVPQVTGLRVKGSTPGAVTVAWNQVRVTDLRRYELDIAEDIAFITNKQTFNVATTEWQFSTISATGGGGDTVIYARVRARTTSGNVGRYSVILDTETGQAQTADIADEAVTEPKVDETVTQILTLRGYIAGLQTSVNATDSEHDIDFASGIARNTTNVISILLSTGVTKQADNTWVAGTAAGGMASGEALDANIPIFMFVLGNAAQTSADCGFDTDPTAANLMSDAAVVAAGYVYFRRLGAFVTDASNNIRPYHQYGDFFQLDDPVQDPASYTDTNPGTDELTHTLTLVPVGIEHRVQMTIAWFPIDLVTWTGDVAYSSNYAGTLTAANSNNDSASIVLASVVEHSVDILLDTDAKFKTDQLNTHPSLRLFFQIHSWVDTRGKDGLV